VAGDDAALDARVQQIDELAGNGRYPSGTLVPAVSCAFTAFERRDFSAAMDDARRMLSGRHRGSSRIPVTGLADVR
jgi:hypothetical protein